MNLDGFPKTLWGFLLKLTFLLRFYVSVTVTTLLDVMDCLVVKPSIHMTPLKEIHVLPL